MDNKRAGIKQSDIAIVMQGPIVDRSGMIDPHFLENLDAVSSQFTMSQIVVSTWDVGHHEIVSSLVKKYSQVNFIFNRAVAAIEKEINGVKVVSNLNRLLVSTLAGLKAVTRSYVVKIRTDSCLYSDRIVSLIDQHFSENSTAIYKKMLRDPEFSVFDSPIINCNLFARSPHSYLPFLFHPGDILLAGKREDLILLFDIPLADESLIETCKNWMNTCYMKLVPEQYLWVRCIQKVKGSLEYEQNFLSDKMLKRRSEQFYLNNFIPYSSSELDFEWKKHKQAYYSKGRYSVYTHDDWLNLYRKYIKKERQQRDFNFYLRFVMIGLIKIYFFIRTQLLNITLVRRLAFKYLVKRIN